jgi:hypothetical protein
VEGDTPSDRSLISAIDAGVRLNLKGACMSDTEDIRALLAEIRDNQRLSLQRQEEHLEIARKQFERSSGQVQESIALQRQAVDRVRNIARIAVPGILICIVLIVYLLIRYF